MMQNPAAIPLPRGWPRRVKSAMLHVISLAQYAAVFTRSWAVNSPIARVRLKTENDRLRQDVALLEEELRIKDARMARIPAQKRPHYMPTERCRFWNYARHVDGVRTMQPMRFF